MTGSILIAGNGKTGTTGAYQAVKSALQGNGEHYQFLFEPPHVQQVWSAFRYAPDVPVLAKLASRLDATNACATSFEKRIMTVRDPRDTLVSTLLFRPLVRRAVSRTDDEAVAKFLDALREKERAPSSWSVYALHNLADQLGISSVNWDGFVSRHETITHTVAEHHFHVLHYEAFVDGKLEDLGDYLKVPITSPEAPSSDSWLSHITRSRSHGAWRHWFTQEDVDRLTPMLEPFLTAHGYDPAEPLESHPSIDPASSSEYVRAALAKRRSEVQSRYRSDWKHDDVTEDECRQLRQRAEDGDVVATYRMAVIYRYGNSVVSRDHAAAVDHALRGAVCGSTESMRLAGELLRERQDVTRARYWEREATYTEYEKGISDQVSTLQKQVTSLQRQLRRERPRGSDRGGAGAEVEASRAAESLRKELVNLRASTSYRLGHAFVRAARKPGRAARGLARVARRGRSGYSSAGR